MVFGGDLNNWLFNHPALSENHSVYAFDLLGHGGSSKEVGDGSIFTLTNSILQAVSRIGIENSNWVGHSLGGAIAMNAAKISPETVKKLDPDCKRRVRSRNQFCLPQRFQRKSKQA
ncbi:MAG: hypothetical protein CM15mP88_3430 [Pseudomonadota bacterium]|nr:MAG: hypothetical protein CM15mP88_3430 [Pseudomonadota bacterium]